MAAIPLLLLAGAAKAAPNVDSLRLLGKYVFHDKISQPANQACVTCHVAENGWVSKVVGIAKKGVAVPGANRPEHAIGGRKPPTIAYSMFKPPLGSGPPLPFLGDREGCEAGFGPGCVGGGFWDGRAGGNDPKKFPGEITHVGVEIFPSPSADYDIYKEFIGPLADQALGPFPNDVELNVPLDPKDNGVRGATAVCRHVAAAKYAPLYKEAWGEEIECENHPDISFKRIGLAISAWEHSDEVNSFSSKRDACITKEADADGHFPCDNFSTAANTGHDLFYGITSERNPGGKNANCAACHNNKGPSSKGEEKDQVYMDFAYHNLGLPPNFEIANFVLGNPDQGLVNTTGPGTEGNSMHFATASLRNVDKRVGAGVAKAYMHNGIFKTLADVVHFYNTSNTNEVACDDPAKDVGFGCIQTGGGPVPVAIVPKLHDVTQCPSRDAGGNVIRWTAQQAIAANCWPAPELTVGNEAQGFGLVGNLGLTQKEESAIVAYLQTLSDQRMPKAPTPYKAR